MFLKNAPEWGLDYDNQKRTLEYRDGVFGTENMGQISTLESYKTLEFISMDIFCYLYR